MDGVWSEIGRPNRFEVDLDAVAHNTEVVRKLVGPGPRIFAALKADAYGYGIVEVARTVLSSGADAISLVNLFDGVKLRDHGISAPLLLYAGAWPTADVVRMLDRYDFMPTVLDIRTAELISSLCRRELKVFVKVDVGLERLGIRPDGLVDFVAELTRLPRLKVHGIYAHMHVPDGPEVAEYLQWQFDRFTSALERLQQSGCVVPFAMVVSTGVLNIFPDRMSLSAIDPGLVFFGLDRQGPGLRDAGLRPALRALKSRLIQVKGVVRAEFTDRAPFRIGGQMKIGIIPMGRYDGIDAVCCGEVLVRGARVHVLGTPYVEHTRIDLTHVPDAEEGDEVVIIGKQGRAEISPEEVAERRGLSSPGMLALAIRDSVPRVYLRTNCDRASLGRE